jgi:hypothetical protein
MSKGPVPVRRLLAILLVLSPAFGGVSLVADAAPAAAQAPVGTDHRGLHLGGLTRSAPDGPCRGNFELSSPGRVGAARQAACTHGPDPAPDGVDVLQRRAPEPGTATALPASGTAAATAGIPCYGNGTDGFRVELVYARAASAADRFATYAASFATWAARMDEVVNASAAETGGTRHIRFVTDASCNPVLDRVTLTTAGASDFNTMVSELRAAGYTRTDRKYVVWADANVYCGIGQVYYDDSASPTPGVNASNGHPQVPGEVARIDNGCWGFSDSVEAHELMHTLGGVQQSAPHATPANHCTDDADRMCYADGSVPATAMQQVCAASHEALFDCNHDDYYSTSPAAGSYLATHWNSASSAFLTAAAPTGTTTTTTVAPTTTTTTRPPASALPSAPRSLTAMAPATGPGVVLSWQAPTTGPVTGYRVYRGRYSFSMSPVASVGATTSFTDTSTAPGVSYYYYVRAVNSAGEGPASAKVRAVAR